MAREKSGKKVAQHRVLVIEVYVRVGDVYQLHFIRIFHRKGPKYYNKTKQKHSENLNFLSHAGSFLRCSAIVTPVSTITAFEITFSCTALNYSKTNES